MGFFNSTRLPVTQTVISGDMLPIYVQDQGVSMAAALSTVAAYIQALLSPANYWENIYSIPVAAQSIAASVSTNNLWYVLQPAGTIATLTLALPSVSTAIDGQEVMLSTTNTVTAITLTSTGNTIIGASSGLSSTTPQRFKYLQTLVTWVRI